MLQTHLPIFLLPLFLLLASLVSSPPFLGAPPLWSLNFPQQISSEQGESVPWGGSEFTVGLEGPPSLCLQDLVLFS